MTDHIRENDGSRRNAQTGNLRFSLRPLPALQPSRQRETVPIPHKKTRPPEKEGAQEKQLYDDDYITMIEKTRAKIAQVSTTPRIIR